MKKLNPYAEAERSIRIDERAKVIKECSKKMTECYELASKIMQRMAAYQPPKSLKAAEFVFVGDTPAPKRKPVTATNLEIAAVAFAIANVKPSGTPLTIKQLRGALDASIGPKTIGAALRALIAQKSVVEGPRGKYGIAPSADGAISEAP